MNSINLNNTDNVKNQKKLPIAVLASGDGSNFQAIIDGIANGEVDAEIKVFITNNQKAGAIGRAKKAGIATEIILRQDFESREKMDIRIKKILEKNKVELVVLAGYMLILKSSELLKAYKNRIINIHPALLPSFPGVDAQKKAFEYGTKVSGITIHFVDDSLDGGAIIFQKAVDISDCETAEKVREKILKIEHEYYKKVIDSFSRGRYFIEGRRAIYLDK